MSRYITIIALLASMIGAYAQQKDYTLNIGDFNEITVANSINVIYTSNPDSAGYATYTCKPEVASAITFSNTKNKLKIEVISDTPISDLPTITVHSLALAQATNWGDSTLTVMSNNPGPQFRAKVIGNGFIVANNVWTTQVDASVKAGNGHIFLSGKAQQAKYTIMSAGAIEAGNLEAGKVSCSMVGTGSIDCAPTELLSVNGMGSGSIFYKGNPQIKNHSIGVKVLPSK